MTLKRICVYCGSNPGARPEYRAAAVALGTTILDRGLELVYGGASVGLMGVIADTVIGGGGKVIGVIPHRLKPEVAHLGLTELHEVGSMHERKKMMLDLADGMIAMPGGFGTFEEIFEAVTWGQLRLHHKPCGMLNSCGYFDLLLAFLDHAVDERFIRREHRANLLASADPADLLDRMDSWLPPDVEKWWQES